MGNRFCYLRIANAAQHTTSKSKRQKRLIYMHECGERFIGKLVIFSSRVQKSGLGDRAFGVTYAQFGGGYT